MKSAENTQSNAQLFIEKANDILGIYEGNTNQLKRQLFESLALASEGDGPHRKNFADIVNAHKSVNELIDALDPLLEKFERALDSFEYRAIN